ncbi:MAG: hypothetical protein J1F68_06275, partial [Clostridiales bacterium]|nr:hypothetical protein [Clostridiales bacterium]
MKQANLTPKLLQNFKSDAETLIFEGYCATVNDVVIYNEGDSYALVANVNGSVKCCFKTASERFVWDVVGELRYNQVEFCGVDPFVTQLFKSKYDLIWETNCYLYVWNGQPLSYQCKQEIHPMSAEFAQKVSDGTHYHAPIAEV